MASSVSARDTATNAVVARVTHVTVHDTDPGTTGALGEVARVAKTYGGASNGTADLSSSAVLAVGAGSTVSHWGAWDGSTFLFGNELDHAPQPFVVDGNYTLNSAPYSAENPS